MNQHNALRSWAQLSRGLSRALGFRGDDEGVSRASETLQPIVDSLGVPEWQALIGYFPISGGGTVAAGGGAFPSQAQLLVPVAATVICIVEEVRFQSATGQAFRLGTTRTILTNSGNPLFQAYRDRRFDPANGGLTPVTELRWDNVAAGAAQSRYQSYTLAAGEERVFNRPVILLPGDSLHVLCVNNNTTLDFNVSYRYRALNPGEQRL